MNRFVIMTVGMTHSGKTTFAVALETAMEPDAVVIDQDNHAAFINDHYRKLRPSEGPKYVKIFHYEHDCFLCDRA